MGKMSKSGSQSTNRKKPKVKVQVTQVQRKPTQRKSARRSGGLLQTLGGLAGGALIGGPLGTALGGAAGAVISHITGFGDYKVEQNSLMSNGTLTFSKTDDGGCRFRHEEFITNIYGSTTFLNRPFPINPAVGTTFPFLSLIARNFEEYEMHGLVFRYKPTSGNAVSSTNPALGVVILATDYDALNPLFASKQQMESYQFWCSTVPSVPVLHGVECKRNQNVLNNLYTRTGEIPVGADLRMYDMGNFQIATEGMQEDGKAVGELSVVYDVTARKPRIGQNTLFLPAYAHFQESPANVSSDLAPFGTSVPVRTATGSNPVLAYASGTVSGIILPNPGDFFVILFRNGGGILSANFAPVVGSAIVPGPNLFTNNTVNTFGLTENGATFAGFVYTVTSSGGGAANTLAFNTLTGATSPGNSDCFVFPIPPGASVESYMRQITSRVTGPLIEVIEHLIGLRLQRSDERKTLTTTEWEHCSMGGVTETLASYSFEPTPCPARKQETRKSLGSSLK